VFERDPDWSPRADPIVRQEASRLRKRLANYYATAGATDPVRIELPIGAYVPVFVRISGEAVAPLPAAPPVSDPLPKNRKWQIGVAVAVAALGVFAALVWRNIPKPLAMPSVAVLPFTDVSAEPASQYFADGLTDEITDVLSRSGTLRVTARSSSFRFRGKQDDIKEVGRVLGVANILHGSVERSGEQVRILAHLDRVSDGSQIWSRTFERRSADLSQVPSELAEGVAENLQGVGRRGPSGHIPNEEARRAVMKAAYELAQMTSDSPDRAEKLLLQAVALDPEYADAYSMLGAAKYNRTMNARPSENRMYKDREAIENPLRKALELNSELSFPRATLGTLAMQYDWDWQAAEKAYQRAAYNSTDADVLAQYAFLLCVRGRFSEADQKLRIAQDLDPVGMTTLNMIAIVRNLEGRFEETREVADLMVRLAPENAVAKLWLPQTFIEEDRPDLALPLARSLKQQFPRAALLEAAALARTGKRQEALLIERPLEEKFPDSGVATTDLSFFYSYLGDEANTMKWLEKAADTRDMRVLGMAVHPAYAAMRPSPRFHALAKRMGL
jgi:adenylate cyclase